jgi:hypothetical protein
MELFPAIHFKSSAEKLFFQAQIPIAIGALVALFEQEKISFSASGLFVAICARGLRNLQKIHFLNPNHLSS